MLLAEIDLEEIEPPELADLCENPVFQALCAYCAARKLREPLLEKLTDA